MTDDEIFSKKAYLAARRQNGSLRGFLEGERIDHQDFFNLPKISDNFQEQVRYWEMRRAGESHRMAEMLATRSFPATKGTDRAFMQGRHLDGSQFQDVPLVGEHHLEKARAAGVSTTGKWYSGSLAAYPGDPEAWVDSTHDVKRICEKRGWSAEGAVKVNAPKYAGEEPGPYRVADDIVDDHLSSVLQQKPELAPRAAEVREEIQGRLSGVHG